ncbi:uncharacterized protein [Populus alba]|nr:uncharacterized protein LOC118051650 isoform X6 [Populus alba]XP_034918253.1 uncharacterized protein LOC118051650 isoform X6 [Populus alba]XP_034918255.1 uncharacterized protein LOC118051650 isoform X6 [Populus alba]XP_034918256.1 uncharacterized protein LOC118051650 isoform X6 [Populus alba]
MQITDTILILIIQWGHLEVVILATGSIMVDFKILHPLMLEEEVLMGLDLVQDLIEGRAWVGIIQMYAQGKVTGSAPMLYGASSNLMSFFPFRCGNLNFARRDFCNHCKRPRYRSGGSPRRGYPGPPPLHAPPRHFPGPSLDLSPGRTMNGYRSPPRDWARDRPRDYGSGGPPPRQGARFSDHEMRRDRSDYADDEYRGRNKFDRPMPMDWGHNDHGRDSFFHERKGFERQPPSPPLPPPSLPQRGRWGREGRDRSRSPISTTKRVHNMYMEQGWRDDRHRVGRGRMRDVY